MTDTKISSIPPDELGQLLNETNFTKREILEFYKYAARDSDSEQSIDKKTFAQLCFENGIKNVALIERLWKVWDIDADGALTHFELIMGLNPILRGNRNDVASFFFDLYDLDGSLDLSAKEVISVYSDMLCFTQGDESEGLSHEQKKHLTEWVEQQQREHGKLDKENFIEAIENLEVNNERAPLLSWRTAYYVFLTAWFEMGTSFALPAMGALSDRIQARFDTNEEGIGTLTSAYFFAAMVGPLVGGYAMDKYGPGIVVIGANILVLTGAILQALAKGNDQMWVIVIGRLLLGFGGEITPFTTVEILGRLFPDYFGLMAGVRNLIQSLSGFLAFVLLPIWAEVSDDPERGTSFALWMCAVLGFISLLACTIVNFSMKKEKITAAANEGADQKAISKFVRAFAQATTPQMPGCRRWLMPLPFWFAVFGIKAQYFAPFGFTAFSNNIYKEKFHQSRGQSSFLSGFISLVAGLMSPFIGELSDRIGKRSLCLAIGSSLSVAGFVVLALANSGKPPVWIASTLFALQYGFGDTVAYISIRFIVGINRSGLGYGLYGVFGNFIATLVPLIGGFLMESSNGINKLLWYFAGLMALGTLCWIVVFLLEGPRSLLELPADQVIETSDEDLKLAALSYIASPVKPSFRRGKKQKRSTGAGEDEVDDEEEEEARASLDMNSPAES
eukprot:CAMPEP_0178769758 /NCGR_PEP_ID=MMETSP0744-20121128/21014_1 /TAXON_ID=913974 /ORGANISM="Nitzschia punctata, Strain CCMP561" /LENGTH=674 /DNA_ID=CAMNT_0020426059 /DNA_START=235 /DNA_END=2259 /DNA_ORIENTATION=-